MAKAATAELEVVGNFAKFRKGIDSEAARAEKNANQRLDGFRNKVMGIAGAYVGVQFFKSSVDAASNLSEALAKNTQVFGANAAEVEKWSKSSADNIQLSQRAAVEAAATYGNLFQGMGIGQQESAKLSTELVQLAGDLASFNNTSVEDAIAALQSGLVGETEPLKKYGILINETLTKEKARAMGLVQGNETLTEATKVQARYALVTESARLALGDIQRTGSGYAGQLKEFKARWENLQATLAVGVLPTLAGLLALVNSLDPATLKVGLAVLAGAFAFTKMMGAVSGVTGAFTILSANPIILVLAGITAAVIILARNWDTVTTAVDRFMQKVGKLADIMPGWLKPIFGIKQPVGLSDKGEAWAKANGWMTSDGQLAQPSGPGLLPGRAKGGPVSAGRMYMVGENGPEPFVPNMDGVIYPTGTDLGGTHVNLGGINIHTRGDLSSYRQQDWEQVGTTIARVVTREIQRDRRSQGQ